MNNIEISEIAKENGFEFVDSVLDKNEKVLLHYRRDSFHLFVNSRNGISTIGREVMISSHNFDFSSEALKFNFEKFEDNVKSLFK